VDAKRASKGDGAHDDRRFERRMALSREARAWALTGTAIVAVLVKAGVVG
jgi:hypothetical protein